MSKNPFGAYTSSAQPEYPKAGESDVLNLATCGEPLDLKGGKTRVRFIGRYLALWNSQLRPIADFIDENPGLQFVRVKWEEKDNRTFAVIETKLIAKT